MRVPLLLGLGLVLVLTFGRSVSRLEGQALSDLASGDTVRVSVGTARITGTLIRLETESLFVRTEEVPEGQLIPVVGLTRLEVARGRKSSSGKGALIGLAIGGALGALAGLEFCGGGDETCYSQGEFIAVGAFAGVLPGALIGAVAGYTVRGTRWVRIRLPT